MRWAFVNPQEGKIDIYFGKLTPLAKVIWWSSPFFPLSKTFASQPAAVPLAAGPRWGQIPWPPQPVCLKACSGHLFQEVWIWLFSQLRVCSCVHFPHSCLPAVGNRIRRWTTKTGDRGGEGWWSDAETKNKELARAAFPWLLHLGKIKISRWKTGHANS